MQNGRLRDTRPVESAFTGTAASAAVVFESPFRRPFRPGYRLPRIFHPVRFNTDFPKQMTRRVSIPTPPLPRHSHENPAIFTENASPPPAIGRDKNAWRTHGQMQRKV
ncbi:hypothetical protein Bcep18194_A4499 [Burkholderia lata]|uniref:Uncharacterized protein n=1 Tax=Burkholderia lata (strain ATCC 17760 / DSM 23089 / LMG 22485 / NCIMB 9086 / R18194 / 383) TaxID=482957 RepID=Q39HH1_BURL3|nr:hypothetical protein Bcep18194_A4499 [Burkholderia lata]